MAEQEFTLTVTYAPIAIDELHGIWCWNVQTHGTARGDAYIRYLKESIEKLSTDCGKGGRVSGLPDLRYILIRRRRRGHGHVAVYRYDNQVVQILHVFHTAQDWLNRLVEETD